MKWKAKNNFSGRSKRPHVNVVIVKEALYFGYLMLDLRNTKLQSLLQLPPRKLVFIFTVFFIDSNNND